MTPERLEPLPAEPPPIQAGPSPQQAPVETGLAEALVTIRKRKWIIIGCVAAGLLYGYYKSATQPLIYQSVGTIEIRTGSSNQFRVGTGGSVDTSGSSIPTQMAILKSDSLLLTVARDLDLANNPKFLHLKPGTVLKHQSYDDPNVRLHMVGALNSNISISTVPKTDIVKITCSTSDRQLSADIVNKLIIDYIHRSFQSRYDATQRASDFLTAQLHDLKTQVEDSQARLIDLGKRVGIIGLDSSRNQINNTLDELSKAAGDAQIARIFAESRYRTLAGMDPASIDPSINSRNGTGVSTVDTLRAQREGLLASIAQLTADNNLGPRHPRVLALKAQVAELDRQIAEEQRHALTKAKEELNAAHINENQTRSALEDEKSAAYKLRDDLIDYSLRQREFESNRALYENLLERLRTAGIQAGLESTEIDIVDSAMPPSGPTLQPKSTILLVDTLVMFVIGLIVAFIIDSLDAGIQTIAELERVLGLPSLALIPRARRAADHANLTVAQRNIGVLSGPKSQFAESFRALRTSLLLSTAGSEPKVILLTSATPSEGKTTAAVNLACVLAQRNVRVLLIDADLRRPTVHHRFGVNGKIGLTSVLSGSVTLQEAVQNFPEIPTLDLLVSGPVPPFPTEMLGSAAMHKLLAQARGLYTHIVLDSPPLLSVTDSVVLARETDAVVLIVRHGKSNKHAIRRGRDILARAGARITGIALNAVDLNSPEYNAYYGYYGYGGYSGYASAGVESTAWETQSDANTPAKPGSSHEGGAR